MTRHRHNARRKAGRWRNRALTVFWVSRNLQTGREDSATTRARVSITQSQPRAIAQVRDSMLAQADA